MGVAQGDDLAYTELAYHASQGNFTYPYTIFTVRWLVYLPTALMYFLFGVTDFTTLFFPVTVSILSVFFVYYIVKNESDEDTGLTASMIYSLIPVVLIYSSFIQVAPYIEFSILGSIFFLQIGVKRDRWYYFLLSGLFIGFITMTRITGLFIVPLLIIYLFMKRGFNIKSIIYLAMMGIIAFIPLIVQGLVYLNSSHHDFFHRLEVSSRAINIQNMTQGMDAKSLLFYIKTMFVVDGFANFTFYSLVGYLFVPAVVYVLIYRVKSAYIFLIWYLYMLLMMTFMPTSLDPYTTLIRNIRYGIVLTAPLVSVIAVALQDLAVRKKLLKKISVGLFVFILISCIAFSWGISSHYRSISNKQKYAVTKVLNEYPESTLYVADLNIYRRINYYSGYEFKDYKIIRNIRHINKEGYFLILKLGYHPDRYRIPKEKLREWVEDTPESWEYLGDLGYFYLYKVPAYKDMNLSHR
jgi:4-amino-4-deoxy-L-arabinose transferase-like glycosyltransferase